MSEVTLATVLTDSFATVDSITANGTAVTGSTFAMADGSNPVDVKVLAEDGTGTTTYSVTFTRAEAMAVTVAAGATITTVNQSSYSVTGTCNVTDVSVVVTLTGGSASASSATATCTDSAWTATADASGLPDGTVTVTAVGTSPGETSTAVGSATKDTAGPVVSVPASITVDAASAAGTPASNASIAAFLAAATAADIVDGNVSVTNDAPSVFPIGATTVTFSAADSLGNIGTATAVVTVEDQSPPVITAPEATTITATDADGTARTATDVAAWLDSVTGLDNVDGALTNAEIGNDAPEVFPLGATTVKFFMQDSSQLEGSATAVLTIADLTAPVVTAPASILVAATNASGTSASSALAGEWKLASEAGALAVGPNAGDLSWWSISADDVTSRACLFDDVYRFGSDGAFNNMMGSKTWLETWQDGVDAEGCGAPVAAHDGSSDATYIYDSAASTIAVSGLGAHIGLPKVHNNGELVASADAVSSITYSITAMTTDTMTLQVQYSGDAVWQFKLVKVVTSAVAGDWKLSSEAGSLAVGPNAGDLSWWSISADDVTTRACLFDDVYRMTSDGTFSNLMGSSTWIEGWQGGADACGSPVTPHDGSVASTFAYDASASTLTVTGLGAHIGLPKVHNTGEIGSPADAVSAITYSITEMASDGQSMTLQVNYSGDAVWQFKLAKVQGSKTISDFLAGATATDNVDGSVAVTNDGLSVFPLGETTVIFSAADTAGNIGTDSATVTVTDQTAPVLKVPADGTVPATDANGTAATDPAIVAWVESAVATDNVDSSVTITNDAPAVLPLGATVVTFTVTDAAGNTSTATATATIADTTAPVITAPAILVVLGESDGVAADTQEIVDMIAAVTATDNVDGAIANDHKRCSYRCVPIWGNNSDLYRD